MEIVQPLGKHLILDLWGEVDSLPFWSVDAAAAALKEAVLKAGTTIMTERWHHFGEGFGYTGVIILAESHLSCHSWPEKGYIAIDAFYCGKCDPMDSLQTILDFYKPTNYNVNLLTRGEREKNG